MVKNALECRDPQGRFIDLLHSFHAIHFNYVAHLDAACTLRSLASFTKRNLVVLAVAAVALGPV